MTRVKRRVFGEDRMAYVLVAAGALMSVLGLYGIATGSRIVQVEAGWTSVIAGSMLFVGGVLTMALGLILRALVQLRTHPDRQPAMAVSAPQEIAVDESMPEPAQPEDEAVHSSAPPLPPHPLRRRAVPVPSQELQPASAEGEAASETHPVLEQPAPTMAAELPEPEPASLPRPHVAMPEHHAGSERDKPERAHPADDYKLETPSTPAHDLPEAAAVPQRMPAQVEDDWLDRTFAEMDETLPVRERAPATVGTLRHEADEPSDRPTHDPEPVEAHADIAAVSEFENSEAETAAPTLPAAPTLAAPTSAVIGRYEADGTSYVMYADGSIEAHSEAGTYRFASMAELKTFIET